MTGDYALRAAERAVQEAADCLRDLREQLADAEPEPVEIPAPCKETHTSQLAPGVWLVEETPGHRSLRRIGDAPDPMPLAEVARHLDAITAAVLRVRPQYGDLQRTPADCSCRVSLTYPSAAQVAQEIVRALYEARQSEPRG